MNKKESSSQKMKLFLGVLSLMVLLFLGVNFFFPRLLGSQNTSSTDDRTLESEEAIGALEENKAPKTEDLPIESISQGPEKALEQQNETKWTQELAKLSSEDQKKWSDFKEIMASHNDNDPRLDQSLKNLSEPLRDLMKRQYAELEPERHNERGLVAFLIARELQPGVGKDGEFLKSVYDEKPCLSMENCAVATKDGDPHHSSTNETSLNYTQMVVLYGIEAKLNQNPDLAKDPAIRDILSAAAQYEVPAVKRKAEELLSRL